MIRKKVRGGLLSFPQNIHIEVTNHCNLQCPMCVYPIQHRQKGFIDFNLFRDIIRQCETQRSLEQVALMGLGEPFLHSELVEMSHYAKSRGVRRVFTSTNATLLGPSETEAILSKPGFDTIAVSIDGATKMSYEKIRRGADFDKTVANILAFISARRGLKKRSPGLVLQFLVMRDNHHEKDLFVDFWKHRLDSCDTIMLRDVDTFGGQVEDHRLVSQMPAIMRVPCLQLWRDMIISWNGDVSVCCKDVNYFLKVGNVLNTAMNRIWNGEAWARLRTLHKNGSWSKIALCDKCSEWR